LFVLKNVRLDAVADGMLNDRECLQSPITGWPSNSLPYRLSRISVKVENRIVLFRIPSRNIDSEPIMKIKS
jgi:hypothetical protein